MAPLTNIKDVLAAISPGQSPRVEEALSRFVSLSEEERKEALPSTIETTFPLVFGENASIESSEDFETLKNKPWYVSWPRYSSIIVHNLDLPPL